MSTTATQAEQFEDTPAGNAKRWAFEFQHARKALEKWHEQGEKIVKRFLDERDQTRLGGDTRWNFFTSNVQTMRALLYGNVPQVSVERRFADANDDVARVAGEMLERILNSDIEKDSDTFAEAIALALDDRLLPGFGAVRVRYVAKFEKVDGEPAKVDESGKELAPAVPESERVSYECAETDYVHWKDMLWGAARFWRETPWVAFGADMTREALVERFGEEIGNAVPLNVKRTSDGEGKTDPWSRARVWEVWHKERRKVYWVVEGYPQTLDEKEDPLGLTGFFPCAKPMFANVTTTKLVPRPDFVLAEDLYNEIDLVSTRVTLLERAIRVAGVYDAASPEVKALLSEAGVNELVPSQNFSAFAEKGGVQGAVDWLPLEMIVAALTSLREYRSELIESLFQLTGMSDIMRGQAAGPATATEQSIKARFASVRMQAMQDEFARFATETQRLKAEIIAKHFSPETIVAESNVMATPDAEFAEQAVGLIQSNLAAYRIQVKPEAVSLTDFAALKQERMEVLQGIGAFLQVMGPIAQQMGPASLPFLLRMLQTSVAGLRGSSAYESILDQAIAAAEQAASQPQQGGAAPDPKLITQQMKGMQDLQKIEAETKARLTEIQAEVQADAQREQTQAMWNTREAAAKSQIAASTRLANPPQRGQGGPVR